MTEHNIPESAFLMEAWLIMSTNDPNRKRVTTFDQNTEGVVGVEENEKDKSYANAKVMLRLARLSHSDYGQERTLTLLLMLSRCWSILATCLRV